MVSFVRNSPVIALVGHMCKDVIVSFDGVPMAAIGGTAYNLAALASVMKSGAILPICRLGCDMDTLAEPLLSLSPLIDRAGILHSRFPNVVHRLTYSPNGDRSEWNSGKQTPLPLGKHCFSTDAVLLNFISGSDVRLADLKKFKASYKGIIYSDFHSLSLGYNKAQIRYHRHHPRWKDYISSVDILQMNMGELRTLFDRPFHTPDDVMEICPALHKLGPLIVNITMGSDGVIISDDKRKMRQHLKAVKIPCEVDPTGCGDTFAAVFLHNYLLAGETVSAGRIAARFAAAKATFSGLDGFQDIHAIVENLSF